MTFKLICFFIILILIFAYNLYIGLNNNPDRIITNIAYGIIYDDKNLHTKPVIIKPVIPIIYIFRYKK